MDTHELVKQAQALIGNILTKDGLKKAGAFLAREAEKRCPGQSSTEKKVWGKKVLLEAVERYDNVLPVVGAWLDLPVVDGLEKAGVDWAVEWGYGQLLVAQQADAPAPVTDAPDLPNGGLQ